MRILGAINAVSFCVQHMVYSAHAEIRIVGIAA